MAAPSSARALPLQFPTSDIIDTEVSVPKDGGIVRVSAPITSAWRYIFSLFAQTTPAIDPAWTQSVSNPPTQAQVEAIVAQVKLLSQVLGRSM